MTSSPATPPQVSFPTFVDRIEEVVSSGGRLGLLTARVLPEGRGLALIALLLTLGSAAHEVLETPVPADATGYLSMTERIPQAHWFERAIYDFFGLRPEGHPRCKSLILHEAWPADFFPLRDPHPVAPGPEAPRRSYPFLEVKGEGVYEIPVGPIHAGIIEPGHFRFSCLGEIIENLEIRLGYQHRGVEQRMTQVPWRNARFLAEAVSSDTAVGNALAHAEAMEALLGLKVPPAAMALRVAALEIERVACHIGDLGGICSDIGFAGGASVFARLRGDVLGLGARLTGARFQTAYIVPGGVARRLPDERRQDLARETAQIVEQFEAAAPLLLDNPGAVERMEGTGVVKPSLARDFGFVGPAARASGIHYDVRTSFREAAGDDLLCVQEQVLTSGDVLARVQVRAAEVRQSLGLLARIWGQSVLGEHRVSLPERLPASSVGAGLVEAWRGELIHMAFTDSEGAITRYCIKDPSFNNWTGLAIAARNELVPDFPLCNKSFSLSYSSNDL